MTAIQAAAELADEHPVLVLPPVWAGLSDHHLPLGGTISLSFDELRGMLRAVARSVKAMGFGRLLIVNGHGGNNQGLTVIVRELCLEFDMPVVATHTWTVIEDQVPSVNEDDMHLKHACEGETSMMMVISPDDVRTELLARAAEVKAAIPGRPHFDRFFSFAARNDVTGTWGDPRRANVEKGRRLIELHVAALKAAILDENLWVPVR